MNDEKGGASVRAAADQSAVSGIYEKIDGLAEFVGPVRASSLVWSHPTRRAMELPLRHRRPVRAGWLRQCHKKGQQRDQHDKKLSPLFAAFLCDGHIGIPLVLALAEAGFRVNVNDTNRASIDMLQTGCLPFLEYGAEAVLKQALLQRRLVFTRSPEDVSKGGPVIITIGTPIDEFLNPVRKVVQDCIDDILPFLADGQLVVLRSTVFPGTTDWLASYLQSRGRNLLVAFCPEQIVQGAGLKELRELPQIVSGTTPQAERAVAELFGRITPEVVMLSPIEAEFAKLFTNSYRYMVSGCSPDACSIRSSSNRIGGSATASN